MLFGARPLSQPVNGFVYLDYHRPDVAKIRLDFASSQVLIKRPLELFLAGYNRSFQLFQLLEPPLDVERFARTKKLSLVCEMPPKN